MSVTTIAQAPAPGAIEATLIEGDLSRLTSEQRVSYYQSVCDSLGLNPLTKPLAYLRLNGKLVLYALKDATEQLRKLHGVSITDVTTQRMYDVCVVTVTARSRDGRSDVAMGAVSVSGLSGDAFANALMTAETKAKRRATLSICGLGLLDETEAGTIPQAQPVVADEATPDGFDAWWSTFVALAPRGMEALKQAWGESPVTFRLHANRTRRELLDELKASAAAAEAVVA